MTIFRYEMKQLGKSIVVWSLALGTSIFLMIPVYVDLLTVTGAGSIPVSENAFFESMGIEIDILTTPIGAYAFLTFFVLFAAGMHGMNMGLTMVIKEYENKSADYLMTKPFSRNTIFGSKMLASAGASVIIGLVYLIASYGGMMRAAVGDGFQFTHLVLIALSVIWIQWLFLSLGLVIGILRPGLRAPVSVSAGTVFLTYAVGSFSRVTGIGFLGYFSPHSYFNGSHIIQTGSYHPYYLLTYTVVLILLTAAGSRIFRRKDVMLVS